LELESSLPPERSIKDTEYSKPTVGTSVVTMGYPLWYILGESSPSLTNGIVSKETGIKENKGTFQLTAKINKGSSGGPVFDMSGNVVGITVGKLDLLRIQEKEGFLPEDVNFAIHVDRMPSEANIKIEAGAKNSTPLSIENLYQKMLGKVVMVATYK
jgi:S1-C subfamily serine protease